MKMLDSDSGGILVTEGRSVVVIFGYEQGGPIQCHVYYAVFVSIRV